MQRYIAYTDGSAMSSLNSGGWSSVILDENENVVKILYQGMTNTTNNRMEIRGVLETLKYFKEPVELHIFSDSMYVVGSIQSGAFKKWFDENDLFKKNLDLWFELVELWDKHKVTIEWVKGHNDNKWNEQADKWATFAAKCLNLSKDIWTINSEQEN